MALQQQKKTVAPPPGLDFFSPDFYSGGAALPEGNYIWMDANFHMRQATDRTTGVNKGEARLTCTIKVVPLEDPTGKEIEVHYSLGTKAHLSFQPDPNTGKSLVPVPNGPASTANNQTNWYLLVNSIINSLQGWPDDLPKNDLTVFDGSWIHMIPIDEPAERKSFVAQTGEAASDKITPMRIPVVSQFLEGGRPWEGGGGIPEAPAVLKASPKATVRAVAPVATKAAPEPEAEVDDSVKTIAISTAAGIMAKNPTGLSKLKLRTETFKAVKASTKDDDMAQAVIAQYFEDADGFSNLLDEILHQLQGTNVVKL